MAIPYEQGGRRSQKARTRVALVAAARELLARRWGLHILLDLLTP